MHGISEHTLLQEKTTRPAIRVSRDSHGKIPAPLSPYALCTFAVLECPHHKTYGQ